MTVHSKKVATDFRRRRCLQVAKVIIKSRLGAIIRTIAVAMVDDYFIWAV